MSSEHIHKLVLQLIERSPSSLDFRQPRIWNWIRRCKGCCVMFPTSSTRWRNAKVCFDVTQLRWPNRSLSRPAKPTRLRCPSQCSQG